MSWCVTFTRKAQEQVAKVPQRVKRQIALLTKELEILGPIRGNWKNYGKLEGSKHHCHIKTGKPTYVACWEVKDKTIKLIEVYYVGTHEKAPY